MAECKCNDAVAAHGIIATYAMLRGARHVLVGITRDDVEVSRNYAIYLKKFSECVSDINERPFEMIAPFIDMQKRDVIELGMRLGANFAESYGCYKGDVAHCGKCCGCQKRLRVFRSLGIEDPATYKVRDIIEP